MKLSFFSAAVLSGGLLLASHTHAQTVQAVPNGVTYPPGAPGTVPQVPAAPGTVTLPTNNPSRIRQLVREVRENTDNVKASGDFGAQLWLTSNTDYAQEWKKPGTPTVDPVDVAQRGQTVSTVIVFYGAGHDNKGLANVDYAITVKRPDGSVYAQRPDAIGFQNLAPASERALQLGRDSLVITIAPADPSGIYTVEANVRDNVRRVTLPLKESFLVQ